ncbi:TIGR04282 family arsenosugar biosynthesis glycosyltransferase [Myxosarcina sp. GI1]|uniref:TIGR04282 family arsenosugar biosynthesis glycosyltransferase n=1 Tax=Myxosarcina sp. GI1 TaxID=1541065 RepID=UPI0005688ED8|nr:TIGR04282 family arsenosugar biosynthesis glycosyltransferase [Myxosarcina sp. GI1]
MSETLIIFSRYPEAGKTKTRMIPALGAEGAAELQKAMTEHTLATVRKLSKFRSINLEIHFAGGNERLMSEWLGNEFDYYPQVAGDLGQKMRSAFDRAFKRDSDRVVTIGIDCPDIDTSILSEAFEALKRRDLVLGIAEDGGYYLIGLNRTIPQLFVNIDWGTDRVLAQTKKTAASLGLNIGYLPVLIDVDRPEDLFVWQKYKNRAND